MMVRSKKPSKRQTRPKRWRTSNFRNTATDTNLSIAPLQHLLNSQKHINTLYKVIPTSTAPTLKNSASYPDTKLFTSNQLGPSGRQQPINTQYVGDQSYPIRGTMDAASEPCTVADRRTETPESEPKAQKRLSDHKTPIPRQALLISKAKVLTFSSVQ
jgi:hypothetical protein